MDTISVQSGEMAFVGGERSSRESPHCDAAVLSGRSAILLEAFRGSSPAACPTRCRSTRL